MAIDFVLNGHRYTNDPAIAASESIPTQYQFIGYNAILALESYAEDITAVGGGSTDAAAASAALAQMFAAAAVAAPGTSATSTTSVTTAYGPCAIVVQPGKVLTVGTWVTMASSAAPDVVQQSGPITSYNPATGALGINVKALSGVGLTAPDWIVGLSAPGGATLGFNQYTGAQFYTAGIFEGYSDIGAGSVVDLSTASRFKKTVTANWTLSMAGIPAGAAACFVLKIVNGGAFTMTLPVGTVFASGVAPILTVSGADRLGFIKDPGGVWEVYVLGRDVK
jgi:hypothetical protein